MKKIIQIIPNKQELYAKYINSDGSYFTSAIICFALVEYDNEPEDRAVIPMDICADGSIDVLADNFVEITNKPI